MKLLGDILRAFDLYLQSYYGYFNIIRFYIFRWKFVQSGSKCLLEPDVRIRGGARVFLGNRVALRQGVLIGGSGDLIVGDRTSINEGVIVAVSKRIKIGSDCMIAPRVYILDVSHSYLDIDKPMAAQGYENKEVVIEDDVWVGANAVILMGVRIGKGSIIAANSVVNRNVTPYSVYGGVPAKIIKQRIE